MQVNIALLTVTDTRTIETDKSGSILVKKISEQNHKLIDRKLVKDEKELIKRLIKRSEDSGRSDDKIEIISKRQKVYWEQTAPIIQYYKRSGILIEVNGIGTIAKITKRIIEAIK